MGSQSWIELINSVPELRLRWETERWKAVQREWQKEAHQINVIVVQNIVGFQLNYLLFFFFISHFIHRNWIYFACFHLNEPVNWMGGFLSWWCPHFFFYFLRSNDSSSFVVIPSQVFKAITSYSLQVAERKRRRKKSRTIPKILVWVAKDFFFFLHILTTLLNTEDNIPHRHKI